MELRSVPSRKNGRFSCTESANRVFPLSCGVSSSNCEKSGRNVASSTHSGLGRHLMSAPALIFVSLLVVDVAPEPSRDPLVLTATYGAMVKPDARGKSRMPVSSSATHKKHAGSRPSDTFDMRIRVSRGMLRNTMKVNFSGDGCGKRSDAHGIRNSALQPSASSAGTASKSKSGEKSSSVLSSFHTPSANTPRAFTRKNCANFRAPVGSIHKLKISCVPNTLSRRTNGA